MQQKHHPRSSIEEKDDRRADYPRKDETLGKGYMKRASRPGLHESREEYGHLGLSSKNSYIPRAARCSGSVPSFLSLSGL